MHNSCMRAFVLVNVIKPCKIVQIGSPGLQKAFSCALLQGKNRLAIPHVSVPSIAWLDWKALRKAGFEGCVLDKDNTLTHPYSSQIAPQLQTSLERCQEAFAGRLVLFSNSAGLHQFDPKGGVPIAMLHLWATLLPAQSSIFHWVDTCSLDLSLCATKCYKEGCIQNLCIA